MKFNDDKCVFHSLLNKHMLHGTRFISKDFK